MADLPRRRRGRPPADEAGRRKEAILVAAVAEFGEHGYEAATVRGIAERAGVDAALVHHHFGTKSDLFSEAMSLPARPQERILDVTSDGVDGMGERLVRTVLDLWEAPDIQRRAVAIMRSALASRWGTPVVAEFLDRELTTRISDTIVAGRGVDRHEADRRTALVVTQVAGLLASRYLLRFPVVVSLSVDELVASVGGTVQRYIDGR